MLILKVRMIIKENKILITKKINIRYTLNTSEIDLLTTDNDCCTVQLNFEIYFI